MENGAWVLVGPQTGVQLDVQGHVGGHYEGSHQLAQGWLGGPFWTDRRNSTQKNPLHVKKDFGLKWTITLIKSEYSIPLDMW